MDLAEIFSENKAKNVGIALATPRLFNAIFWKKIKKYSRITFVTVLKTAAFLY
jgi:predicted transcriptional regulator